MRRSPIRVLTAAAVMVATVVAGHAQAGEFPDNWFWGDQATRAKHAQIVGTEAPPLSISTWHGEPVTIGELKGKVVVVDLWATWCGPCMQSIPKNIQMVEDLSDKGLVFVGVHDSRRGVDRLPGVMESRKINYSVGVDDAGKTARAYGLAFWPTYAVIDRKGIVRAIGLQPEHVRAVVTKLLNEPAPSEKPAAKTPADPGARAPEKDAAPQGDPKPAPKPGAGAGSTSSDGSGPTSAPEKGAKPAPGRVADPNSKQDPKGKS